MPTYNLLRSYLVVESHEVQAKTYDEAIQMIENNPYEQTGNKRFQKKLQDTDLSGLFIDCYSADLYCC